MGATVTTGKCAAAFRSSDGEILYVLFERSYEKNCYPHTPRWSAFAFGTREEVLRRAFTGASSCCSGMLQSRSGGIKPENYIESWKQEINHPVWMRDFSVYLEFDRSWYALLPENARAGVWGALERAGLAERFEAIRSRGITATLWNDTDLLRAIYGVGGELSPWRVFSHGNTDAIAFDVPVIRNIPVRDVDLPAIRCFSVDTEVRLVAGEDGRWQDGQWAYSALADFVTGAALERELVHPGYARAAIPVVRDALNHAPPLPLNTRITVRRSACQETYQEEYVNELARGLGLIDLQEPAPEEFSFLFSDIRGDDHLRYRLGSMRDVLTWDVPDVPAIDSAQVGGLSQSALRFA